MEYWLIGIAGLVSIYGGMILDRLPKPKRHKDFQFELGDIGVTFRADTLIEHDLEVAYVDDWLVGRSFSIYGPVVRDSEEEKEKIVPDLNFGKRTGVRVTPTADWFQSSRIGYLRSYEKGGCETFIALPHQIANRVLDELRRCPDQFVSLRVKRSITKGGKPVFGVYSFELSTPFD